MKMVKKYGKSKSLYQRMQLLQCGIVEDPS